ncbi:retron St85 family effector protein [Variovorax sp. Root434]|uniref:retron St85 family effector protein n=1 Tax=Variovorax sp. Root434 TaxID=1736536 RepID=UPI000AEFCB8F|nr:retron St85 family effector protein [Variovorax sp. Root434]
MRRLPKIILVFGSGPIGVEEENRNSSFRNVFLNWAHENESPLRDQFHLPEDYPEWNRFQGYQNLVDFEREAGALSGAILLFSEGSGALAELGVFCMDEVLSERLLVVISRAHFDEDSFLVHGPLKKLEGDHSEASICVVEANEPRDFYAEASDVADALQAKVNNNPRKELIRSERIRDQLLLIVDLVELFGAATETEIIGLLSFLGIELDRNNFRRMVGQLKLFKLVDEAHQYAQKYYVAPLENRESYMDYDGVSSENRFDRTRFKTLAFEQLKKESIRRKAYEQIHGKVQNESN